MIQTWGRRIWAEAATSHKGGMSRFLVILPLAYSLAAYIIGAEWCFGWVHTRKHCISAMGGDIWIILVNGEPGFSRALSVTTASLLVRVMVP